MSPAIDLASTIPDWLGGIGGLATAGALFVALAGLQLQARDRKAARQSELELNLRKHELTLRAQARLVAAWSDPLKSGAPRTRRIWVANGSDEPVFDVNLFLPPRRYAPGVQHTRGISVLPPRSKRPYDIARRDPEAGEPAKLPRVEIIFTDRDGRRWLRDGHGRLTEMPDDLWDAHFADGRS